MVNKPKSHLDLPLTSDILLPRMGLDKAGQGRTGLEGNHHRQKASQSSPRRRCERGGVKTSFMWFPCGSGSVKVTARCRANPLKGAHPRPAHEAVSPGGVDSTEPMLRFAEKGI